MIPLPAMPKSNWVSVMVLAGKSYRLKCGDCEQSYIGETGRTASVLSIATKMFPRPRFSVYIRMVEDTCWPPWSIPRTGGAETILAAIESTSTRQGARVLRQKWTIWYVNTETSLRIHGTTSKPKKHDLASDGD